LMLATMMCILRVPDEPGYPTIVGVTSGTIARSLMIFRHRVRMHRMNDQAPHLGP